MNDRLDWLSIAVSVILGGIIMWWLHRHDITLGEIKDRLGEINGKVGRTAQEITDHQKLDEMAHEMTLELTRKNEKRLDDLAAVEATTRDSVHALRNEMMTEALARARARMEGGGRG